MSLPKNEILRKIAKLLAVTEDRGATVHEAANAAVIARRMLDKYQLSIADVEHGILGENIEQADVKRRIHRAWTAYIVVLLNDLFCVKFLQKGRKYVVFGHASDALVASHYYTYLERSIHVEAERAYEQKNPAQTPHVRYTNTFAIHALAVIAARLRDMRWPSSPSECTALVALGDQKRSAVNQFVDEILQPTIRRNRSLKVGDPFAAAAGKATGQNLPLYQAVTGTPLRMPEIE